MKKILAFVLLAFTIIACCNDPQPSKLASFQFTVNKDTLLLRNLKKIYALGAVKDTIRNPTSFYSSSLKNQIFIPVLPISYVADSTVYVLEYKNKINDTITALYQRNVDYDGSGRCGYIQTLSSNTKRKSYSTLKNYNLDVSFGSPNGGSAACSIRLSEK
jgi:hypothetical protein